MRTLAVYILVPFVTIVYSIVVIIHMVLFRDKDVFFRYARSWSRLLLRIAGVNIVFDPGTSRRDPTQRYIYAANHASLFDIPVLLASIPDNIRIMYKRELESIPFLGWCLRISPFIAINRNRAREATSAIKETAQSIARNASSVLIFPEGTRSADGRVQSFRRGFVTLASVSRTQVIPVAITGTATIMPARSLRFRGGAVRVQLLPAVSIPENLSRDAEHTIARGVQQTVADAVLLYHDA